MYFNSHAHVERDFADSPKSITVPYFNSHAHVERDKMSFFTMLHMIISTHTLTWSVT